MKVLLSCLIMILGLSGVAMADDLPPAECRYLPAHQADAGVAYQPGVDVHGKPVVPADLDAAPVAALPETITVPLSIDLAERLRNSNVEGLQLEAPLGMLEIHQNGRVVYDGKDWTPQIYALCGQNVPAAQEEPSPAAGNGQAPADDIKSDAAEIPAVPAIPAGSVEIEGGESRQEGYK
jgi:hypothetical protein